MIPLYDTTPRRSFPFVNYALIAANIYVFYLQLTSPNIEEFTYQYAFIPSEFNFFNPYAYLFILSSIFLHGGFLHILSNMWFLRIFGDNIEDELGHFHYLLFYLAGGIVAALAQYLIIIGSDIPMLGASGAISAVSGAYLVLHGKAKIKALIPFFGFISVIDISAKFFLIYWFAIQLLQGVGSLGMLDGGGVAFFAHIGGFVFGFLYAKLFVRRSAVAIEPVQLA